MSKKNSYHPYELPDNISHWETNFTEMKHKVIDYLKKHTTDQIHPIIDAQHYLILNSNHKTPCQNPSLSCVKINKNHINSHHNDYDNASRGKTVQQFHHQTCQKTEKGNIFKNKCKVSLPSAQGHYCEDECMRGLPPICSIQLEKQQKKSKETHKEATLKQKLDSANKFNLKNDLRNRDQMGSSRKRYRSIEQKRSEPEEKMTKPRPNSTFKRVIGDYQRIKTHWDTQKKNIFFIPVAQYLRQHQEAINFTPMSAQAPKNNLQDKESNKEQPEILMNIEPIKPIQANISLNDLKDIDEDKLISICGIQPKKQLHNNIHKRFYAHSKEHRQEVKVLEKQIYEKFVFSPWESIRQEATIANLDNEANDA